MSSVITPRSRRTAYSASPKSSPTGPTTRVSAKKEEASEKWTAAPPSRRSRLPDSVSTASKAMDPTTVRDIWAREGSGGQPTQLGGGPRSVRTGRPLSPCRPRRKAHGHAKTLSFRRTPGLPRGRAGPSPRRNRHHREHVRDRGRVRPRGRGRHVL